MPKVVLNHVGHCVSDLDRSRRFYTEVLGFEHWRDYDAPDDMTPKLLRLEPPVGLLAVYLRLGDFVLELLHYRHAGQHPPARPRTMDELGLTHLSVSVEDVPATCEAVVAHGGEVLADTDVGAAVMVKDPDGQLIELLPMSYAEAMRAL